MLSLILLILPILVASYFMAFKMPAKVKDVLLKSKTSTLITASVIAFGIGHLFLAGQLALYSALAMDMLLTPIFMGIRCAHFRKKNRVKNTATYNPSFSQLQPA